MDISELIQALSYDESPNFLRLGTKELQAAPAFGHIFRKASLYRGLKGVYVLRPELRSDASLVPVVYVCEADSDEEADITHGLVWNQDVVPFLIICTPDSVRLYSGFRHNQNKKGVAAGVLRVLKQLNDPSVEGSDILTSFNAQSIDDGTIWKRWGREVNRNERVDWQLLGNLKKLDRWLREFGKLSTHVSHSLIGKYVYLHYLRDRNILSDRKLESWGITPTMVFGRDATLEGLKRVVERLEYWLNGGIFPLDWTKRSAPKLEHLHRVAATFAGDEPNNSGDWQMYLDFQAYDFSYIPIETLSVVYEQFLHTPASGDNKSRGREAGAYYTPIPLVNFMLAEIDSRRPINDGMSVLDPSCGSGAFLVQCYRKLVETTFPVDGKPPRPIELRDLLVRNIFGVDRDSDACGVTELSLILTLLDYVDPPDLENDKRIKLPSLRNKNIFCSDLFDPKLKQGGFGSKRFDWIVGNPPWKKLKPKELSDDDLNAWNRMQELRRNGRPIGGNQLAQLFMWEIEHYLAAKSEVAILIPAMTLFEDPSREFRTELFGTFKVDSIANFSNLAEVLFAGRSRVPAAAFFYKQRKNKLIPERETINVFSPLVANQESTRPVVAGTRNKTWNIILNASEVRAIPTIDAVTGSGLPWKIATWGSYLDLQLLARIERKYIKTIGVLQREGDLTVSEGPQLRVTSSEGGREFERDLDVVGKPILNMKSLARHRNFFAFPKGAFDANTASYIRSGGGDGLAVCKPPHIIVSAARNFAVFSNKYIIVPPRQIGIASPTNNAAMLKALSLYLNSDFAYYHQFLTSTELGVKRDRATLASLRHMPVPVEAMSGANLSDWIELHDNLAKASARNLAYDKDTREQPLFGRGEAPPTIQPLLDELNELVSNALGLSNRERILVHDLVHLRLQLNDGKLGDGAIGQPDTSELEGYRKQLENELNTFTDDIIDETHQVSVVYDHSGGMVIVDLVNEQNANGSIQCADNETSHDIQSLLANLRRKHAQWVYFDRSLRVYEGTRTYLLKPLQRFHWSRSQATIDGSELIAEALAGPGGKTI